MPTPSSWPNYGMTPMSSNTDPTTFEKALAPYLNEYRPIMNMENGPSILRVDGMPKETLLAAHEQDKAQAIAEAVEAKLQDFAEFCHEQYLGCGQTPTGWEYSYKGEVVTMLDEYRAQLRKGAGNG
jgi:hypothetical protein